VQTARLPINFEQRRGEHLVALNPVVLSEAEHALGNLFQRIHHVTRMAREALGPYAERLNGAVQDLEDLLELVFDYVSPVELDLRPMDSARVLESLAAQMRGYGAVEVAPEGCPRATLLADGRALSRSFQLIGRALWRELGRAAHISVAAGSADGRDQAHFHLASRSTRPVAPAADGDLAWAVAGRLIELHGGELRSSCSDDGVECTVTLPLRVQEHDRT